MILMFGEKKYHWEIFRLRKISTLENVIDKFGIIFDYKSGRIVLEPGFQSTIGVCVCVNQSFWPNFMYWIAPPILFPPHSSYSTLLKKTGNYLGFGFLFCLLELIFFFVIFKIVKFQFRFRFLFNI